MRSVALLILGACGGAPALANAPRANPSAVAGVAAGAAAAITLASPGYGTSKPEKPEPKPIEVHEQVSPGALDRLDQRNSTDAAGEPMAPSAAPAAPPPSAKPPATTKKPGKKPPHVPLPSEAIKQDDDAQ